MIFPSIEFCVFFPVVLLISWALMGRPKAWKPFILAASYLFYGAADPRFAVLLAAVTLFNQLMAVVIHRQGDERTKSRLLFGAVTGDLLILGVFKYYGFFATEINGLLDAVGLGLPVPLAAIALPIGVSFYTFQAISYVVDVRRRVLEPGSTIDVAIYLAFFPHVVAGPIVRAREFLPQLTTPRDPSKLAVGGAVVLIGMGLLKKVVAADLLARELVDPVFAVPEEHAAPDVLLAIYGYAVQIYCDFSGYTDMAIGFALLLGFVFPQNFLRPYRARSFSEFWRRWHITLSRYLRDFLYIPLGGNRGGTWKTMRNLMITMLLGGLWHGAAWGFVLWGGIHGGALAIERLLRGRVRLPAWAKWVVVFHIVCLAWVPFRAPDLADAGALLSRLTEWGPAQLWSPAVVGVIAIVVGSQLLPEVRLDQLRLRVEAMRPATLGLGLTAVVAFAAATIPSQGVPPFIYFAF